MPSLLSLYDLTAEALSLLADAERAEDDADPEAMQAAEEAIGRLLAVDLPRKVDAYGEVLTHLAAVAGACQSEERRLAERRRALEARAARMRDRLADAMRALGVRRLAGTLRTATLQASPPTVEVTDEEALPEWATIEVVARRIDKAALGTALRRGEDIPGARLVLGEHVRMR